MLRLMLRRLAAAVGSVIIFAVTFELSVLPSFSTGVVTSQPRKDIITKWENFDRELNDFLNDVSGIETIEKAFEDAERNGDIAFEPVDGKQLVQEIAKSIGDFFSKRVQALQNAVKHAEKIAADYEWNENLKEVDCLFAKSLNDTIEPFAYDKLYDQIISLENSSIHIPVDIFNGTIDILNSIAWTSGLDEVWKKNKEEDPSLVWQYFGSQTGVLRYFPATSWKNNTPTDLYDVRRSKWYTQGVSLPKDMLILIERSGSSHGQALQLIKHSVKSLIDTLSENDFVNIAHFSDKPNYTGCFHTLVQATEKNKKLLKGFLQNLSAQQVANYKVGFEFAFENLKNFSEQADNNQQASCNRVIMLFTDGTSDVPRDVFEKYNSNKTIRVFSYAVGPMAGNRSTHTREIACSNKGFFYPIPAMGAIRAQVQDYAAILSGGISAYNALTPKWSNVYDDFSRMDLVMAVTMPVFLKSNSSNNFSQSLLGVMGVDITLKELMDKIPSEKLAPNGYAFGLNSNGILLFHPVLDKPRNGIVSPVIDFAEIEDTLQKEQIRKEMIDQLTNSEELVEFVTAPDEKHAMRVNQTYHYTAIPGTQFSVAVVIPEYVRNYISAKRDVNLEDGIELLRTNESQMLFDTTKICKPTQPLDTNITSASSESNMTLEELVELLSLNESDCDFEAVQKLLFDVMITSCLEDKWAGKECKKQEKRNSIDLSTHELNHDQKRDINGVVTNEPTHDQAQDSHDPVTSYPTHDQMQNTHDSVASYSTLDHMQDLYDSVTNEPTRDPMHDSLDSVTSHDEKPDSNDLLINDTISDDETRTDNESSFNRIKRNAVQSMDVIYARFVTMGKDFSRVHYQSAIGYEDEGEKEKLKAFMEGLHNRTMYDVVWIFALYPEESDMSDNASLIFASKTVTLKTNNYRAATIGVQFTLQNFSDLVSSYESSGCNSLPEGSSCYVLDDGGFVLSQNMENMEDSVGKFFGNVESGVMKALIDDRIYVGRTHIDNQTSCACETPGSAGFRIVPPFIFEMLSLNWWTTATTWTYMNMMNLYSWLFTTQVPYVAASEDNGEDKVCVESSYQYHFGNLTSLDGDAGCDNCTQSFAASRLNSTNLLMVAVFGDSCICQSVNITLPSKENLCTLSSSYCNAKVRYRKKPPCSDTNPYEPDSYCGAASIFVTSPFHVTLLVSIVFTKLLICRLGGH